MANRNTTNGGSAMGKEDALSTDWNDTFKAVTYRRLANSATGGTHNTTTPTLITTHVIAAGDVNKSIELLADVNHNKTYSGSSKGASEYFFRVDVGETGSESTIVDDMDNTIDNGSNSEKTFTTRSVYYEPTTDEKTNGFNVKIYLYVGNIQSANVDSAAASLARSRVMGV